MRGLGYGRRIYDRWGRHPHLYRAGPEIMFLGRERSLRRAAVERIGLRRGDSVLDLGCGHGVNLALLEARVGPSGRVLALDYSDEMLATLRDRADKRGWRNVETIEADAARVELPRASLDGALATLALSVIPDQAGAIRRVRDALKPGAALVVLDGTGFAGRARLLNPLIRAAFSRTANWDHRRDLPGTLRDAFGEIELETFNGGSIYLAVATRALEGSNRDR